MNAASSYSETMPVGNRDHNGAAKHFTFPTSKNLGKQALSGEEVDIEPRYEQSSKVNFEVENE